MSDSSIKIVRHQGHYTLIIDGTFVGNYDTVSEAAHEAEDILSGKLAS